MTTHGPDMHGWPGEELDLPPHHLDLDAIVRVGRRQVRHRRIAVLGGTAAVLAAVAAIPATMPLRTPSGGGAAGESLVSSSPLPVLDCDVAELPLPEKYADPGPDSFPYVLLTAMDPSGRYAVGNAFLRTPGSAGTELRPDGVVIWDDERASQPALLRDGTEVSDVNADGVLVGGGEESGQAWTYRDGQVSPLPTPDGYESAGAGAINAAGDVAGTAVDSDGRQTMVVWPASDPGSPRVLAAPPERDVAATGITDDGRVLGEYHARESEEWPADEGVYLWEQDGSLVELPVPEGAYSVYGTAVRGNWAVGQAMLEPEGPQAPATGASASLRWDLTARTLRLVAGLGGVPNQVRHVNAAGEMVFIAPPAVSRGGEPYALPDPVREGAVTPPETGGAPLVAVTSISDDGSAIAGNVQFDGPPGSITELVHPVMWRC